MKDLPYTCRCSHCGQSISFDGKMLGETFSCPKCNQDTKLYSGGNEPAPSPRDIKEPPYTVHYLKDGLVTLCCDKSLNKLPPNDRVTDELQNVTCSEAAHVKERQKQAELKARLKASAAERASAPKIETVREPVSRFVIAPPIIPRVQRPMSVKQSNGLIGAIAGACVLLLLCALLALLKGYSVTHGQRDSLQSEAGQEYGLRDHMTTQIHLSDQYLLRVAHNMGMDDEGAREFVKGYDIGWNLVGQY